MDRLNQYWNETICICKHTKTVIILNIASHSFLRAFEWDCSIDEMTCWRVCLFANVDLPTCHHQSHRLASRTLSTLSGKNTPKTIIFCKSYSVKVTGGNIQVEIYTELVTELHNKNFYTSSMATDQSLFVLCIQLSILQEFVHPMHSYTLMRIVIAFGMGPRAATAMWSQASWLFNISDSMKLYCGNVVLWKCWTEASNERIC